MVKHDVQRKSVSKPPKTRKHQKNEKKYYNQIYLKKHKLNQLKLKKTLQKNFSQRCCKNVLEKKITQRVINSDYLRIRYQPQSLSVLGSHQIIHLFSNVKKNLKLKGEINRTIQKILLTERAVIHASLEAQSKIKYQEVCLVEFRKEDEDEPINKQTLYIPEKTSNVLLNMIL